MRTLSSLALVALVACGGEARPPTTSAQPAASAAARPPVETREVRCRDAARACGAALVAGADDEIVDCMPAEALKFVGGRDKVVAALTKGKADLARDGWSFDHVDLDAPASVVRGTSHVFAIVPQRITMKMPEGHVVKRGYLLGVSTDDGATWKFVDGEGLTGDNVKVIFTDFPATLALPARTKPELLP
ncbi:MAG TPA: hypothetical protein VLM85_02625 [Polyangiaceae bacterium]|nr:hypothetical protein [Polyangiaceae bacterium]